MLEVCVDSYESAEVAINAGVISSYFNFLWLHFSHIYAFHLKRCLSHRIVFSP